MMVIDENSVTIDDCSNAHRSFDKRPKQLHSFGNSFQKATTSSQSKQKKHFGAEISLNSEMINSRHQVGSIEMAVQNRNGADGT